MSIVQTKEDFLLIVKRIFNYFGGVKG